MWEKAEELLNIPNMVLPAAGATNVARQVGSLSAHKTGKNEPPHFVTVCDNRKLGTEVKCDCPVYRSSSNICQHAIATADDLNTLSDYLLWVRRTKKSSNLSHLIADSVPKNAGQKSTSRRKGPPKSKKKDINTYPTPGPVSDAPVTPPINTTPAAGTYTPDPPSTPGACTTMHTSPSNPLAGTYTPFAGMPYTPYARSLSPYVHAATPPSHVLPYLGCGHSSSIARGNAQQHFTLHRLAGTQIRMCYGPIRSNTSIVPSLPHDIVIRYKERRYYHDPETQALKLTSKEENTYHLMQQCILMKHPSFTPELIFVPPEILHSLTTIHKVHLYDNFGLFL